MNRSAVLLALLLAACANDDDEGGEGSTGDGAGTEDSTETGDPDGGSVTSGMGDSGAEETGPPPMCDPNDPMVMVDPRPLEQPGDTCCTDKEGCSGEETDGKIPQVDQLGNLMMCVDGIWTVDESGCEGECPAGTSYIGCYWWGPLRNCGCQ